jgi:hypothetical protein
LILRVTTGQSLDLSSHRRRESTHLIVRAREIDYYGALKGEEFLDGAQLVALIIVVTVVLVRVVGLYFMGLAII